MEETQVLQSDDDFEPFKPCEDSDDEMEETRPPTPILKPKKTDSRPNADALEFEYKRKQQQKNTKKKIKKTVSKETIPDYVNMSQEDQDEWRAIFRGHFMSISSDHPKYDISYPGDHESLTRIHLIYIEYIKQICAHMNAESYRVGLVLILAAIELFGTKYLKMPFSGFTQHQINNFDRYRSLLLKMGEENWNSGSSSQPAFVQMLMFGAMQLVLFGAVKFLSQYVGAGEELMSSLGNSAINMVVDSSNGATLGENLIPKNTASGSEGLISAVTNLMSSNGIMDNISSIINKVSGGQSEQKQSTPRSSKSKFV